MTQRGTSDRELSDVDRQFLEVRLSVKDGQGRELVYSCAYELVAGIPKVGGQSGWMMTTGVTDYAAGGVRAEVEIKRRG